MGLAGPKTRRKLDHDPNNTKWSRNEKTFGQKILRAHGWEPGKFLGAQGSSHSELHTAASSAPIKINLKDDNLGLGAKPRQKQSDVCTGLNGFQDLLGRLNGESEESIAKKQQTRSNFKTTLYVERKYGPMRFISGGLLVGDQMSELLKKEVKKESTPEESIKEESESAAEGAGAGAESKTKKQKKEKKSKKRKAEDADIIDAAELTREEKRKKRRREKKSRGEVSKEESTSEAPDGEEESRKKMKSKKSRRDGGAEDTDPSKSKKKSKKSKSDSKSDSSPDRVAKESTAPSEGIAKTEKTKKRKDKKEKKDKKRKQLDSADSDVSTSAAAAAAMLLESGSSTPQVGTGASTPQMLTNRHMVRSRNIASKRMAMADLAALNQIFMVKPV
ncbi:hypothetical protein F4778DRAFT_238349 [Xylariomycetidae sp. FL2044]|nr:hypothetical protein F4778DRAFT_238349 [Xylariomycetidae sp. FL2044]